VKKSTLSPFIPQTKRNNVLKKCGDIPNGGWGPLGRVKKTNPRRVHLHQLRAVTSSPKERGPQKKVRHGQDRRTQKSEKTRQHNCHGLLIRRLSTNHKSNNGQPAAMRKNPARAIGNVALSGGGYPNRDEGSDNKQKTT